LEDAYGNIKEFSEAQVVSQMKIGTLNIINLALNENNKLIRKAPEVLEMTEDNIGNLECFPTLVKVFDLTTEKEGTAVAVGFKKQDGWRSILNVVINGNMYEASMRSTLNRNIECKKSSCITCKVRHTDKCRYNRHCMGRKLCVEIGAQHSRVAYVPNNDSELLAVAVDNGIVRSYCEKYDDECNWNSLQEYEDFNSMHFCNAFKWGGVLHFDVPMIEWKSFRQKIDKRFEFLKNSIKEMEWQAVNENYIEINHADYELRLGFWDNDKLAYWDELLAEYYELGGSFSDIFDEVESYIKQRASEEGAKLWWLEEWDVLKYYSVDKKGSFRGKHCIERTYMDMKYDLIENADCPEDKVGCNMDTNIFDNNNEEVEDNEE
jgi:hypothetical protein